MNHKLNIVFMGTPDFAVPSLEKLIHAGYQILAVITAPDKPSGRGLVVQCSPVKKVALQHNIPVLQPTNLKDQDFINQLQQINPDLQVVVAFRMLPKVVWDLPKFGTINLHASLLPDYRGAAPINWAIINGETQTGATTFFLNDQIDTGDIIDQITIPISPNETAGELHDTLMNEGASLVLSTVRKIEENKINRLAQTEVDIRKIQLAPKIFKENCKINWHQNVESIHNFIRGLSPYPAAFFQLISPDNVAFQTKVFKTEYTHTNVNEIPGSIVSISKNRIDISGKDGIVSILELQLSGKKRMLTLEFLKGFGLDSRWKAN